MRRAARHAVRIVAALSLLLCLAVCVLWVRSGSTRDGAETARIRREADGSATAGWFELSSSGRLWLRMSFARVGREGAGINWDSYYARADATGGRWRWWFSRHDRRQRDDVFGGPEWDASGLGPLRWKHWTQREPAIPFVQRNVTVGASHWLAAALLMILPACVATRRLVRRRRARLRLGLGLCPACGYDLRATPEHCPECGTAAAITGAAP